AGSAGLSDASLRRAATPCGRPPLRDERRGVKGLTDSARTRDKRAFRELAGPHLRALQLPRYPILGSIPDADDALQKSFLAPWPDLADFEGRPSIDTWLYRITTNSCQNTLPI